MKYILGKKIEMTRLWQGETVVPVTKVAVGPCSIVQIKTSKKDGYDAVQIAYGERKAKNIAKPQLKHTEGLGTFRWMREFKYNFAGRPSDKTEFDQLSRGDVIDASTFAVGDMVNVVGHSKGRGFQGGVKRHGFHGHNTTHGTKDQVRMPGSIGAGEPQHVFKGTRMAGRMGNERVTVQNLEVIEVNLKDNTILIKGGLPGARNSLVLISGAGELTVKKETDQTAVAPEPEKAEAAVPAEAKVPEIKTEDKKTESVPAAEPVKVQEVPSTGSIDSAQDKSGQGKPAEEVKPVEPAPAPIAEPAKVEEVKQAEPVKAQEVPSASSIDSAQDKSGQGKPESASPAGEVKPIVAEPVKIDEKIEEKPVEPAPKDIYLKMFDNIPQAERERLSSPEAMVAITALEETYKIDMLPILAKLATKEVTPENLTEHLVLILKTEQAKAEEIAKAIKEKKLC
jgi:large subunit ribosomal protein L3